MNYTQLINLINTSIQSGVPKNVTSAKLRQALLDIAQFSNETRGDFQGTAAPSDNPGTPATPVYFFATTSGTYTNFGGLVVDITDGINIISFVPGSGWSKAVIPVSLARFGTLAQQHIQEAKVYLSDSNFSAFQVNANGDITQANFNWQDGTAGTMIITYTNGAPTLVRYIRVSENREVRFTINYTNEEITSIAQSTNGY